MLCREKIDLCVFVSVYACVCVCVCVRERKNKTGYKNNIRKTALAELVGPKRLRVQSLVGAHMGGNQSMLLSHISLSLSFSLKSINIFSRED